MVTSLNSANLNSAILDSTILHKKLHLFILTQLDDGNHLQFGHLEFSHLSFSSQSHPHLPRLDHTISKKKQNFTHSFLFTICTIYFTHSIWLTWWWQPSWILPSWIQPFWTKLWLKLIQSDSNSFILTQLDDGSHLEFSHLGFSHLAQKKTFSSQTHSHLAKIDSQPFPKTKNSFTLPSSPSALKYFSSFSDITWWWQPSWIPPSWIQPS